MQARRLAASAGMPAAQACDRVLRPPSGALAPACDRIPPPGVDTHTHTHAPTIYPPPPPPPSAGPGRAQARVPGAACPPARPAVRSHPGHCARRRPPLGPRRRLAGGLPPAVASPAGQRGRRRHRGGAHPAAVLRQQHPHALAQARGGGGGGGQWRRGGAGARRAAGARPAARAPGGGGAGRRPGPAAQVGGPGRGALEASRRGPSTASHSAAPLAAIGSVCPSASRFLPVSPAIGPPLLLPSPAVWTFWTTRTRLSLCQSRGARRRPTCGEGCTRAGSGGRRLSRSLLLPWLPASSALPSDDRASTALVLALLASQLPQRGQQRRLDGSRRLAGHAGPPIVRWAAQCCAVCYALLRWACWATGCQVGCAAELRGCAAEQPQAQAAMVGSMWRRLAQCPASAPFCYAFSSQLCLMLSPTFLKLVLCRCAAAGALRASL